MYLTFYLILLLPYFLFHIILLLENRKKKIVWKTKPTCLYYRQLNSASVPHTCVPLLRLLQEGGSRRPNHHLPAVCQTSVRQTTVGFPRILSEEYVAASQVYLCPSLCHFFIFCLFVCCFLLRSLLSGPFPTVLNGASISTANHTELEDKHFYQTMHCNCSRTQDTTRTIDQRPNITSPRFAPCWGCPL